MKLDEKEEVDENDICIQTYYLDNALTPETQYCYEIYGVNIQGIRSLAQTKISEGLRKRGIEREARRIQSNDQ